MRALPSTVLGPVDSPPWKRQRRFPGTTLMMQGTPARVFALHLGRYLRFKGSPLGDRPRSSICRHQCRSRQVTLRHARPVLGQGTTVVIETNSMFAGISVRNLRPHDAHARVLVEKYAVTGNYRCGASRAPGVGSRNTTTPLRPSAASIFVREDGVLVGGSSPCASQ